MKRVCSNLFERHAADSPLNLSRIFRCRKLGKSMNKRQSWVRADKLQSGDRVQDTKGNIVTIKDVNNGIWPGSILITLRDANPDFVYVESDTRIFVE
jgi:hypothetical protein